MKILFASLAFALSLSTCQKDETISGVSGPDVQWQLVRLNGEAVETPITLTFPEKGRLAGQAPCNSYFGEQTAPLPWFETGAIGATRRACPEMELEGRYFKAFSDMTMIERKGDTLLLTNDSGGLLEYRLQ
ncbi:META domain-containing protein [Neptunicoccus cionae]|uniref:META domain-containing protein n=1 Tax=Neptunicoccus cionae TaxID=2035344 RepID=UPI000C7716D8|nr:META domain-containing protein [Amylibacter cionae]PLS21797.1 META domain-containing protein [Amylibacter cionae]